MSSCPLVSVLMTVYNRDRYIAEAIESVLAQTFQDFELIIVDDGSKDRSVEIAQFYGKDARIRIHRNEKNLGDYPNRNRAAGLASGTYLKYVDSDDVIYPHCLDVMTRCMEKFPEAGVGLCSHPTARVQRYPTLLSPREAYAEHFLERSGLFERSPLSSIIRASAFREVGGFSGKRYVGDYEMWLRLAARYPVVALPPHLGWWRSHGNQEAVLGADSLSYAIMEFPLLIEALTASCCPLTELEKQRAIKLTRWFHARAILRYARRGQYRSAREIFRKCPLPLKDLLRGLVGRPQGRGE